MFVYLLRSKQKTYIGATVDVQRRLRQHNGIISGGAKYTKGRQWKLVAYVSGFPNWMSTLQFEWRWKVLTRKKKGTPLVRRYLALHHLLCLPKPTLKAIPFSEWTEELIIHIILPHK